MEDAEKAEKAFLERKVRKAFQTLLLQRGRNPGVKGWELKRHLGRDYRKILEVLSGDVRALGLEVHEVKGVDGSDDASRFLLRFRDPPTMTEAETSGIRIDDLAVLASSIAYINSREERAGAVLEGEVPEVEGRLLDREVHQEGLPRPGREVASANRLEDSRRDRRENSDDPPTVPWKRSGDGAGLPSHLRLSGQSPPPPPLSPSSFERRGSRRQKV